MEQRRGERCPVVWCRALRSGAGGPLCAEPREGADGPRRDIGDAAVVPRTTVGRAGWHSEVELNVTVTDAPE